MSKDFQKLLGEGSRVLYFKKFYSEKQSGEIFQYLKNHIKWRSDKIKMFGRVHSLPRLQAWYAENKDLVYTYSRIELRPQIFTSELKQLVSDVENKTGHEYNSVLLNYYRGGDDYVSWHADDEAELGECPAIASLSFGGTRKFVLRSKADKNKKMDLMLEDGSLLLMDGETQHKWEHQLPRSKIFDQERINCTFRYCYPSSL